MKKDKLMNEVKMNLNNYSTLILKYIYLDDKDLFSESAKIAAKELIEYREDKAPYCKDEFFKFVKEMEIEELKTVNAECYNNSALNELSQISYDILSEKKYINNISDDQIKDILIKKDDKEFKYFNEEDLQKELERRNLLNESTYEEYVVEKQDKDDDEYCNVEENVQEIRKNFVNKSSEELQDILSREDKYSELEIFTIYQILNERSVEDYNDDNEEKHNEHFEESFTNETVQDLTQNSLLSKINSTIIWGISIFVLAIGGNLVAKEMIRSNPFKYSFSALTSEFNLVIFLAKYGIYIALAGLAITILGCFIELKK